MPILTCAQTELPNTPLPTEFRLFAAGANPTSKGTFVFDSLAAQSVMAAFARDGVDALPLDLEHDSLNPEARLIRNDATDAMGWFTPAVRNGELWATRVRWTPAGATRLQNRSQRFISPAANYDTATMRIQSLVNAAICARPALQGAQALVAASKSTVIGSRVSKRTAETWRYVATSRGITVSDLVKLALQNMLAPATLPKSAIMTQLLKSLALDPKTATADDLKKAIQDLIDSNTDPTTDPGADALNAVADAQPIALSAETRAQIKAKGWSIGRFILEKHKLEAAQQKLKK